MIFPRASGILLHPTSLPGRLGIGDLGESAYRFVDFLANSGQRYWQIMPLGPTSYGDSPYQTLSAFAGNPLLIDLGPLLTAEHEAGQDYQLALNLPAHAVDYGPVINLKYRLLRLAYEEQQAGAAPGRAEMDSFVADNQAWLADYALFAALKDHFAGASWDAWEPEIATRRPAALAYWQAKLAGEIRYYVYTQYLFFSQWSALKSYANQHGVRIIGDIPIFVAYDSADAWAHPELFHFDEAGRPTMVAGVPPDFFSPTGQRWGNPLYRWDAMARDDCAWWTLRFKVLLRMVDVVRLDHFRGFQAYWVLPAADKTAVNGKWVKGQEFQMG